MHFDIIESIRVILTFILQVIHWLHRENIPADKQHRWIQTPPWARTKLIDFGHVRQMITIKAGTRITTTAPIPSDRKHPDTIKAEMEGRGVHGDFGLTNVGLTLAEAKKATPGGWATRKKCDSCMFIPRGTSPGLCNPKEGSTTCENCLILFGRLCSYTLGIPAVKTNATDIGNSFDELASRRDTANALRRTALNGLRGSEDDAMMTDDPIFMEIEQGEDGDLEADMEDEVN
jgi:hypothetical protein